MSRTTDFESELLKLFKAYGASEYQRGDRDARDRIMRAAGADVNAAAAKAKPAANGKTNGGRAPAGAARAFLVELLGAIPRGMVYGDIEEAAKNSGKITHWAVRRELHKGKKKGLYGLRGGRWQLREAAA